MLDWSYYLNVALKSGNGDASLQIPQDVTALLNLPFLQMEELNTLFGTGLGRVCIAKINKLL
jgi:hypothetical protein